MSVVGHTIDNNAILPYLKVINRAFQWHTLEIAELSMQ